MPGYSPIGVFDSGFGGLTIFRRILSVATIRSDT